MPKSSNAQIYGPGIVCLSALAMRATKGLYAMTIPQTDTFAQPESPQPCPCCGRTPIPYNNQLSALVDMLLLLKALVHDVKHQVEELTS